MNGSTGFIARPTHLARSSSVEKPAESSQGFSITESAENPRRHVLAAADNTLAPSHEVAGLQHIIQGKRRRAKRTESERIEYLASDQHVRKVNFSVHIPENRVLIVLYSTRHTVSFVRCATSGLGSDRIQHIAQYHGTLTGRLVWPESCE